MEEKLLQDQLLIYYKRLFPFDTYCDWLAYAHEGNTRALQNREFSFTLAGDIYIRYNSFATLTDLKSELTRNLPIKIDLGAEYNHKPSDHRIKNIVPLKREFVFDIDMTDYDSVRKCCQGGNICNKCWAFMQIAVKILDVGLRDDFGYEHILYVYSGRRGIHIWVCDAEARSMDARARSSIAEYFNIIPSQKKKEHLFKRSRLHPNIRRAVSIIDKYFVDLCVKDQDILGTEKDVKMFLSYIRDPSFANELENDFKSCKTSLERWGAFLKLYDKFTCNRTLRYNIKFIREEIKIIYAYPRLDINVTKGLKHLLKSPFCVHPKTGRICVPFNPNAVDKFNPLQVPTLDTLLNEVNKYDEETLKPNNSDDDSQLVTSLKDARKTSLIKSLHVFEQFVSKLKRLKGCPQVEEGIEKEIQTTYTN